MEEQIIKYLKFRKTDDWEYWLNIYRSEENLKFNADLERKAKKYCCPPEKSYLWLTLSPDKYLRNMEYTPENVNALSTWCKNWFENFMGYGAYEYVVENGSEGDHLHVHALIEMKNSHKHAEKLKKSWNRHFPNNQLLTSVDATSKAYHNGTKKGEYCYANFKSNSIDKDGVFILQDKINYMDNSKKGCHENLSDTGVRGSRGVLSDIS
jgi:hypothetical protein